MAAMRRPRLTSVLETSLMSFFQRSAPPSADLKARQTVSSTGGRKPASAALRMSCSNTSQHSPREALWSAAPRV